MIPQDTNHLEKVKMKVKMKVRMKMMTMAMENARGLRDQHHRYHRRRRHLGDDLAHPCNLFLCRARTKPSAS
jgi:hypothetical protein